MNDIEMAGAVASSLARRMSPRLPDREARKSEEALIGAIFSGMDMPRLEAEDFSVPLYRMVVTAANVFLQTGKPISIPGIVWVLSEAGNVFDAPSAMTELVELMEWCDLAGDIKTHYGAVQEAARVRRMSAWLRRLDEDLCLGRVTFANAKAQMREALK